MSTTTVRGLDKAQQAFEQGSPADAYERLRNELEQAKRASDEATLQEIADLAGQMRDLSDPQEREAFDLLSLAAAGEMSIAGLPSTLVAPTSTTAELPAASFPRRALALIIDDVLVAASLMYLLVGLALLIGDDGYELGLLIGLSWFISIPAFGVYWALMFALSEWVSQGRTPGKALLGIAVRNAADGRRPTLGQLLNRELRRMLYMLFLVVPFFLDGLAALRDPRGQTWHDRRTDTIVSRVGYRWTVGAAAQG